MTVIMILASNATVTGAEEADPGVAGPGRALIGAHLTEDAAQVGVGVDPYPI